jgi:hypothetical protein
VKEKVMNTFRGIRRVPLVAAILVILCSSAFAAPATFPMKLGEAAATCFSGFKQPIAGSFPPIDDKAFVTGIVDVSDPKGAGVAPGTNWMAPMFHNEVAFQTGVPDPKQEWTAGNLGQVFGLALDDASPPNLYVTATTSYGLYKDANNAYRTGMFGPNGPGGVYRLDGATGKIVPFASLPNSGPGLGDVAYDRVNRQLFVTNFDDGLIYRLAGIGNTNGAPGTVLSTFDFGVKNLGQPDTSGPMAAGYSSANSTSATFASGFRKLGQRPWGIQVFNGRVYFGNWTNDGRADTNAAKNTIWSIGINPSTGDFAAGPALLEITLDQRLPKSGNVPYSSPVSDIAFSSGGKMLIAERTMTHGDVGPDAIVTGNDGHQSRVLEFTGTSGNWGTGTVIQTGGASGNMTNPSTRSNSEGGVDYGYDDFNYTKGEPFERRACDGTIWATGEQILGPISPFVYGLQGTPATGNSYQSGAPGYAPNSYAIDLNGVYTTQDKSRIGDVEIYRASCNPSECLSLSNLRVLCAGDGTGDYIVDFDFKNLTTGPIYHLFLIPPTGVTASPNYVNLSSSPVPSGGTVHIGPIRIHGALPGSIALMISIHNQDLVQCCAVTIPIELPRCECAQITKSEGPFCQFNGHYGYSFSLQNLFNGPVSYLLVTPESPATATFTPNVISLNAPLQYGQTGSFLLSLGNVSAGQTVCFRISTHSADFRECCSIRICVKIPKCFIDYGDVQPASGTIVSRLDAGIAIDDPNGDPSVRIPLPPNTIATALRWEPIAAASLEQGAFVEQSFRGSVDGGSDAVLANLRTLRTPDGSALQTSFPATGATRATYEFRLAGERVGVVRGVDVAQPMINTSPGITTDAHFTLSSPVGLHTGTPADSESLGGCEQGSDIQCHFAGLTFPGASVFRFQNAATLFTADEIRVFPENGKGTRLTLSSVELHAHNLEHLTLTSVEVLRDCNGDGEPDDCDATTPAPGTVNVSLNTGFNQSANAAIPAGANDDDWQLLATGRGPAKVVIGPNPAWPAALPSTQWISADAAGGKSPGGDLLFERCFCLSPLAGNVKLDASLRADDSATVLLNGKVLGGPGGTFSAAAPLTVSAAGAPGDGVFLAGANCLQVRVSDAGGVVTGLDLAGSVTATGPACAP